MFFLGTSKSLEYSIFNLAAALRAFVFGMQAETMSATTESQDDGEWTVGPNMHEGCADMMITKHSAGSRQSFIVPRWKTMRNGRKTRSETTTKRRCLNCELLCF